MKEYLQKMIADRMKLQQVKLLSYDDLLLDLRKNIPEVVLTLGAGDIDKLTEDLEKQLKAIHPN